MMKPYLVEQLEPYDGDPKGFVAYGPKVLKEKVLRPDVIAYSRGVFQGERLSKRCGRYR